MYLESYTSKKCIKVSKNILFCDFSNLTKPQQIAIQGQSDSFFSIEKFVVIC